MSGNRSVARELFKEPNLLILDEATSALDTEMGRRVARTLGRSATSRTASMRSGGEVTVVLIAHRLPGRSRTWTCCLRAQGEERVVEEGPYDALRSRGQSRFRETARDAAPVTRTAL